MKTKLLLSALFTFSFFLSPCTAQVPQGFNYQAIARDGSGNPITGATIKVKLSVLSDTTGFYASGSGAYIWEEEHLNVKTNSFGLFTVVFGDLSATKTLGTANSFSAIDWSQSPLFIGTKIANPTTYKNLGSAKLWSVPYSMVSGDLAGPLKKLAVTGETSVMDEALFEVKNNTGQTVFAVYNEGVRIYVDDGIAKGVKGGFAIGGFGTDKDGVSQRYFLVRSDSIRMYIDDTPGKASKGGFAIGGFGTGKNPSKHLLIVNPDSIRAYIDTTNLGKGVKGGFAIGGFGTGKGTSSKYLSVNANRTNIAVNDSTKGFSVTNVQGGSAADFMNMNQINYFLGHQSGKANTTGKYNSFLGYQTGILNDTGSYNTILGYQSGYMNDAHYNVFLGFKSGFNNSKGISNTFLGHLAGYQNSTGSSNVFLGDSSGYSNLAGTQNIFLGNGSGKTNNADYNAFIGYQAGYKNVTGTYNSFIGYQAGYQNQDGSHNNFIGYMSGWWTWKGSRNIFIGYKAGYYNYGTVSATGQPGNNNIYIGESTGTNNISGNANVYIGLEAGYGNSPDYISPPRYNVYIGYQTGYREYKGAWNTFIGYQAGYYNNLGNWSTFIGYQAGFNHLSGNYNTFIGYQAGVADQTGANNTYIGNYSGYKNMSGTGNVFIGFQSGYNTRVSNRLQISNTSADSLIYGEFDNKVVRINNKLGIGITPGASTQALEVSGSGHFTSLASTANHAVYADANGILTNSSSDISLKENISTIDDALAKVLSLRGVTFSWKNDPTHAKNIGFIAQEVENVLPELVFTTPSTGKKGVDYAEITAVLAESVKEQQAIIKNQEEQINSLKTLNEENSAHIRNLEQTVQEIKSIQGQLNNLKNK